MSDQNGKSAAQQLLETVRDMGSMMASLEERFATIELNQESFLNFQEMAMRNWFASEKRKTELDNEQMMLVHRIRRGQIVARSLINIETLSGAMQDVTDICPCGNHKGIRFYIQHEGEDVVLHDNMCPVDWWKKQHRLAFKKKDKTFLEKNPLETYLGWYRL